MEYPESFTVALTLLEDEINPFEDEVPFAEMANSNTTVIIEDNDCENVLNKFHAHNFWCTFNFI